MTEPIKPVDWPTFVKLIRSVEYGCFSQFDLGRELGVYGKTVGKWESGRHTPRQEYCRALFRIAKREGIQDKDIPRKHLSVVSTLKDDN